MAPHVFVDVPNSNRQESAPGNALDNFQRIAPHERCDYLGSIGPHSGELIGSTNANLWERQRLWRICVYFSVS